MVAPPEEGVDTPDIIKEDTETWTEKPEVTP